MQRPKAERDAIALQKIERQKRQLEERERILREGKSKKMKPFEPPADSDLRKSNSRKEPLMQRVLDSSVVQGVSKLNLSGEVPQALNQTFAR